MSDQQPPTNTLKRDAAKLLACLVGTFLVFEFIAKPILLPLGYQSVYIIRDTFMAVSIFGLLSFALISPKKLGFVILVVLANILTVVSFVYPSLYPQNEFGLELFMFAQKIAVLGVGSVDVILLGYVLNTNVLGWFCSRWMNHL